MKNYRTKKGRKRIQRRKERKKIGRNKMENDRTG
jgi:hypothetical protein